MELVFIDFETATASRDSACSLGLVHVINGQIAEKKQWLIQPPHNDYNSFNTEIHGITPEMTENSPTFGELWNNISQYFSGKTLVAHNASFDMSVLRATLNYYNIPFPCFDYFCTLVMARAALPKRITYSLDSLCDEFGIAFKHHDATEDAYASFELYKRIFQISEQEKIDDFLEKYGLQLGKSYENGYTRCGIVKKSYSIDFKSLHAENDIIEEHPFFGKKILFTGTLKSMSRKEAAQLVVNIGAEPTDSFNKNINYLIVGDFDFYKFRNGEKSSKLISAEKALQKGSDIEIISEEDFLKMIPDNAVKSKPKHIRKTPRNNYKYTDWGIGSPNAVDFYDVGIVNTNIDNKDGTSRQELISDLSKWQPVEIKRQQCSKDAPNAIGVFSPKGQIGNLSQPEASQIADLLDEGGKVTARVCQIYVVTKSKCWSCWIELQVIPASDLHLGFDFKNTEY